MDRVSKRQRSDIEPTWIPDKSDAWKSRLCARTSWRMTALHQRGMRVQGSSQPLNIVKTKFTQTINYEKISCSKNWTNWYFHYFTSNMAQISRTLKWMNLEDRRIIFKNVQVREWYCTLIIKHTCQNWEVKSCIFIFSILYIQYGIKIINSTRLRWTKHTERRIELYSKRKVYL